MVRNIVDIELSKDSADWILNRTEESVVQVKKSIDERNKDKELISHHQYISRFSLGNVMKIIEELQLYPLFFQISNINFKDYHQNNRNFGFIDNKKVNFSRIDKVDITLHIFWTLRNRSFQWENLRKMRRAKNGKVFPRLNYKLKNTIISLDGDKIEKFLAFLLDRIDTDLRKTL